jgi:hypothetical protein
MMENHATQYPSDEVYTSQTSDNAYFSVRRSSSKTSERMCLAWFLREISSLYEVIFLTGSTYIFVTFVGVEQSV